MISLDMVKTIHGATGEMTLRVNASAKQGEFVVIMGESGAGKSTLLRIIAGLEAATGRIVVHDEVWLEEDRSLPLQRREVGFVFQDYALFDNMSVKENLLYVNSDETLAQELMGMMEIEGMAKRNVRRLSGGQKQRVALARALMRRPKVLLMDEPLSSLDPRMRHKLAQKIAQLHKRFGMTTLMVSHDVTEAGRLADRIWFIEEGRLEAYGTDILERLY